MPFAALQHALLRTTPDPGLAGIEPRPEPTRVAPCGRRRGAGQRTVPFVRRSNMLALDNLAGAFSLARGTLALFGLAAALVVALPEPRDALLRQALASTTTKDEAAVAAKVVVPVAAPVPVAEPVRHTAASESAQDVEQRALAEFIARRYRVAESASSAFVSTAFHAGREHSVDPLLILAVMAIESGYNPVAESSMG